MGNGADTLDPERPQYIHTHSKETNSNAYKTKVDNTVGVQHGTILVMTCRQAPTTAIYCMGGQTRRVEAEQQLSGQSATWLFPSFRNRGQFAESQKSWAMSMCTTGKIATGFGDGLHNHLFMQQLACPENEGRHNALAWPGGCCITFGCYNQ